MARFEVRFDCGDSDRLPEFRVIEWTTITEAGRVGRTVASFYDEEEAHFNAICLNHEDDVANFG